MKITQPMIDTLVEISLKAGDAIMEIYQHDFETIQKDDGSPLTQADLSSNQIICDGLLKLTPCIPIISEESHDATQLECLDNVCWLVDPLDGTKEFINKRDEFTTNIALIVQNQPVFGIIYAPALNELYVGGKGIKAFTINAQQKKNLLALDNHVEEGYLILGSRSHKSKHDFDNYLDGKPIKKIIPCGSSLKFCQIAKGCAHIYPRLGPTMLWDTAAGQAILESVGGLVHDLSGNRLKYLGTHLKNPSFIASIPLHAATA